MHHAILAHRKFTLCLEGTKMITSIQTNVYLGRISARIMFCFAEHKVFPSKWHFVNLVTCGNWCTINLFVIICPQRPCAMQIYIWELKYWKVKVSMEHVKINVSDITAHMQVNHFFNNNY